MAGEFGPTLTIAALDSLVVHTATGALLLLGSSLLIVALLPVAVALSRRRNRGTDAAQRPWGILQTAATVVYTTPVALFMPAVTCWYR
jgi:hypothetical protein